MPNDYLHNDPDLPMAWSPWFAHEYLSYFAAKAIDPLISLPSVEVRTNPHYGEELWPTGPRHIDLYKESYQERRQFDPLWTFDYKKRNGDYAHDVPSGKTIEPWKVLVLYSTEPDLYLDYDQHLNKNQKITGGSHGWRHMYFNIMGKDYGIAPQSYRMHKDLAKLAFENGNPYWGWRYLSRCGHYLADLGHPFHVKALPGSFLMRKIFARDELFKIVSAIHQSYEIYVERRFREGFKPFRDAVIQGARDGQQAGKDVDTQLKDYIRRARKKHNPIFYFFYEEIGKDLLDAFAPMDQNSPLDAATQTNRCSADAARVLFNEVNHSKLEYLDVLTGNILLDVGIMLGTLFSEFAVYASKHHDH